MSRPRRYRRVEIVTVALFALAIVASALGNETNTTQLPVGLSNDVASESTQINCTGLSGGHGVSVGVVDFVNSASVSRNISARMVSSNGVTRTVHFRVTAHRKYSLATSSYFSSSSFYGVSATVDGGGVAAFEVETYSGTLLNTSLSTQGVATPCVSTGSSVLSFSGLSTHVGYTAVLTLLNPTSTVANVNVEVLTSAGLVSPNSFQGVVVAPGGEATVNLNSQIVNTVFFSAIVRATQGSVVGTAVESWNTTSTGSSLVSPNTNFARSLVFAGVTTNTGDQSDIAIANPSSRTLTVHVSVKLAGYDITPYTASLAPFSTSEVLVSPTTRVPAAGPATVIVTSDGPISGNVVSQVVGQPALWFNNVGVPALQQILQRAVFDGWSSINLVNPTAHSLVVQIIALRSGVTQSETLSPFANKIVTPNSLLSQSIDQFLLVSTSPAIVSLTTTFNGSDALAENPSGGR